MKHIQKQLKHDIHKRIGHKIANSSDIKVLMNLLEENNINDIGFNTLRRFWNLLPQTNASQTTLNKLSNFLGYRSFFDYTKEKNKHQKWLTELKLQELKNKDRLSKLDLKFIQSICETHDSVHYFIAVFEHTVNFKKWEYLSDLFNPKYSSFLKTRDISVNTYTTKLARFINIYLNNLPQTYFDRIIEPLITNYNFRYYIIYSHIDMMNLNCRYGEIINLIKTKATTKEEQIFLSLLNGLWSYLNTGKAPAVNFKKLDLDKLPTVLVGRYYGYQILQAKVLQDKDRENKVWTEFKKRLEKSKDQEIKWFLFELLHHLLIIKDFEKLNYINNMSYEILLDDLHLYSYFDIFIYNLIDIILSYQSKDFKRAKIVFNQIDTDIIENRYYRYHYMIFYFCIGYHIHQECNLKLSYKKKYFDLVNKTEFKVFDQNYLDNFLSTV
mgnify:FL=1